MKQGCGSAVACRLSLAVMVSNCTSGRVLQQSSLIPGASVPADVSRETSLFVCTQEGLCVALELRRTFRP